MIKYYKDQSGDVLAYYETQIDLVGDKTPMTDEEINLHLNPPKTQEQLVSEWKANRQNLVDNIEVTYDGIVYQGDEVSQTRMSRAITALPDDTTTVPWVAKDNTVHSLNRVELKGLLFQAGLQQSTIWNEGRPE